MGRSRVLGHFFIANITPPAIIRRQTHAIMKKTHHGVPDDVLGGVLAAGEGEPII